MTARKLLQFIDQPVFNHGQDSRSKNLVKNFRVTFQRDEDGPATEYVKLAHKLLHSALSLEYIARTFTSGIKDFQIPANTSDIVRVKSLSALRINLGEPSVRRRRVNANRSIFGSRSASTIRSYVIDKTLITDTFFFFSISDIHQRVGHERLSVVVAPAHHNYRPPFTHALAHDRSRARSKRAHIEVFTVFHAPN
jgi:ribosomal protein S20|tara:strand:- start:6079 stop:6663 length:585 start_codon:yes stop_codon:yes gene_type:complete